MTRFIYLFTSYITSLLILIPLCVAHADEIVLENGDRLTGTVVTVDGETLTIDTNYSDPIKIQKSKIKRIYVNTPVEIHLSEGEILKGKIRSEGDGRIIVEAAPGREAAFVEWQNVSAINPPPKKPYKWSGNISLGAGHQSGNTDRINASIGAEATRKTERDRYSLRFLFNYAKEDGELAARNTYGAGKYDYFFLEKLYGYLGVELLSDEFKDLNLRTVVGPGLGYQFWDDAIKFLLLEGGISYFNEDRDEAEDDDWVTGRLASNVRYYLREAVVLSDQLIIYPSLADFGEYQLRNEAAITSPLAAGWSLKLTNILERDSDPPAGIRSNDWNWILGVQYDF